MKCSETLSKRVSNIIRSYVDHVKIVAYMAVSFITFFRIHLISFCIIVYMFVCFVCFCLVLQIMYCYCYVYEFLLLCLCNTIVMYVLFSVFCYIVLFCLLLLYKRVLYYCHSVSTQLQSKNISYTNVENSKFAKYFYL